MKKLLPLFLLGLTFILLNNSCKKENNTTNPNDTTFTSKRKFVVYIDNQNKITRYYEYDAATNALMKFTRYYMLNDTTASIVAHNADSSVITNRIYRLDTNGLAKYSFLSDLTDSTFYEYDSLNYLSKVRFHGTALNANWNNAGNLSNYSSALSYSYNTTLVFKVDLFSPSFIVGDNKLTGNNPHNVCAQMSTAPSMPGQGPSYAFSYRFMADSSGYITKMFNQTDIEPVEGTLNYYTYIVE